MVKSMTGFGKAEAVAADKKFTVEVRSLNSKQLDLSLRAPSSLRSLDPGIRATAARVLQRGKCDIFISVESLPGAVSAVVDEELFSAYLRKLSDLAQRNGIDPHSEVFAAQISASILRMPDVASGNGCDVTEQEGEAVMGALDGALDALDGFRAKEGARLMEDISPRIDAIEAAIARVVPFENERADAIRNRIRESIEKVGVAVDANRLEQEMIFYIEKLDITEEKVRLAGHCSYFREVVAGEENPGRKLGFIAQEMGREINTLGSKANHADIQRIVVGMKDELEKVKEQLLNIM